VTSRLRIAELARKTLDRVADLGGPRVAITLGELLSRLVVDGRELGPGYGHATAQSSRAIAALNGPRIVDDHPESRPRLDGVYSGKAAAALLRLHRDGIAPLLFWATKATTILPAPSLDALRDTDRELARWMRDDETAPGRISRRPASKLGLS
jgi:hypothetical protein